MGGWRGMTCNNIILNHKTRYVEFYSYFCNLSVIKATTRHIMSKQTEKIKELVAKREKARLGGGEKAIEKQHAHDQDFAHHG